MIDWEKKEPQEYLKQLYRDGDYVLYPDENGDILDYSIDKQLGVQATWNSCKTEQQAKRIIALGNLMNVALYVNHGWQPNWQDRKQEKWYLIAKEVRISNTMSSMVVAEQEIENKGNVYFRSRVAAAEALILVGKEVINDYYAKDWMNYEHTSINQE